MCISGQGLHRAGLALGMAATCWAQTTWLPSGAPAPRPSSYYGYDVGRDRVLLWGNLATYELVPGLGWSLAANNCPNPFGLWGGVGYDSSSASVICNDLSHTARWTGTTWLSLQTNPIWAFRHIVTHTRRGTVMAFGGPGFPNTIFNDLYEWNGITWVLVPTTNQPPMPFISNDRFVDYRTCAYDERRDKIVLVGKAVLDIAAGLILSPQPEVWEWDEANQWVQRSVSGTPAFSYGTMFYDSQRGALTLMTQDSLPVQMLEWDGGALWRAVSPSSPPPSNLFFENIVTHNSAEGITFVTFWDQFSSTGYSYRTVSPATFTVAGPGCTGSLGEPQLRLTHNWTRAWLGGTLSVDLTNLPQSAGFVVIGWSATNAGAFTLPLPLDPYGMPGCMARVSVEEVRFVAGSNHTATTTMPVPLSNALLGLSFYQQGYAVDPAANAAGLVAGNAVGITVGRL